jgi:hypothetical protein
MIQLFLFGYFLYLNITAIIVYNKNYYTNIEIKYQIYPRNYFVIGLLFYSLLSIGLSIWDLIDVFVIQKNIFVLNDGFSIFTLLVKILSYIEMLLICISSIIIITRKSVIVNDKIITCYGVYQFNEIDLIQLKNKNTVQYYLNKKSTYSVLSLSNFKVKGDNGKEILDFIKEKSGERVLASPNR